MRVLVWHVHGGWMRSFLSGNHEYLVPVEVGHGFETPSDRVRKVAPEHLRGLDVDLVVLQRPDELDVAAKLLGRVPGRDVPAVFVEHNTPKRSPYGQRHPLAAQRQVLIVHVTHFNRLIWDCGEAPTAVIEHGIADPGARYTGELPHLGVVVNEPVRRGRVTGTDLLPRFAAEAPLDCFGIDVELLSRMPAIPRGRLRALGDLPTSQLHSELARRRAYLHPYRWTSLGLSLLEAMHLGMPVLALAVTEVPVAVSPGTGVVSNDPQVLLDATRRLMHEPAEAWELGRRAREYALQRYGLPRFLAAWDAVLAQQLHEHRPPHRGATTSTRARPERAASRSTGPHPYARAVQKGTDR